MNKIILIHGDVTFYQAQSIPETARKVKVDKGFIVEKGEGMHTHVLENECEVYIDDSTGRMYFKETTEIPKINHEEHGIAEIKSPTKIAYKDLEQEFDYESMETRNTQD